MCFIETRTTNVDGFEFRTYHFINRELQRIDAAIADIGEALKVRTWIWDEKHPLSKYIAELNKLSLDREAELLKIRNMTADDLIKLLNKN